MTLLTQAFLILRQNSSTLHKNLPLYTWLSVLVATVLPGKGAVLPALVCLQVDPWMRPRYGTTGQLRGTTGKRYYRSGVSFQVIFWKLPRCGTTGLRHHRAYARQYRSAVLPFVRPVLLLSVPNRRRSRNCRRSLAFSSVHRIRTRSGLLTGSSSFSTVMDTGTTALLFFSHVFSIESRATLILGQNERF